MINLKELSDLEIVAALKLLANRCEHSDNPEALFRQLYDQEYSGNGYRTEPPRVSFSSQAVAHSKPNAWGQRMTMTMRMHSGMVFSPHSGEILSF